MALRHVARSVGIPARRAPVPRASPSAGPAPLAYHSGRVSELPVDRPVELLVLRIPLGTNSTNDAGPVDYHTPLSTSRFNFPADTATPSKSVETG